MDACLYGKTDVPIDIYIDGYNCPPDDKLFGVQTYITVDETLVEVINCSPNIAEGCDPGFSICDQPAWNVYRLACFNFNLIPTDGPKVIGTINVDCIAIGITDLVIADDLSAYGHPVYDDGVLADCNMANLHPTDGILLIVQLGAPCSHGISPHGATVNSQETVQFTADEIGCCDFPPNYVWSDTCIYGDVDQNGLFTADATCVGENCHVDVTDIANTGMGGDPPLDTAPIEILPLVPCDADISGPVQGVPDGEVGLSDLVVMKIEYFNTCPPDPSCLADCNGDGEVGITDLVIMKQEYFRSDCPECP
jgi:hypothetical protein